MALNLKQFSFSKRKNSTLQPTGGSDSSIHLKNGANIISPTFTMNSENEPAFNYCQFEGRYYFVKSKTNIRNDLWEIECIEDFLATHKSVIGSTEAIILYATGGRDDIADNRINLTDDLTIDVSDHAIDNLTITESALKAIVGIVGNGSNGMYALDNSVLLPELLDGVDQWIPTATTLDEVVRQIAFGGGASNNFKSAIGLPIVISNSELGSSSVNLYLGNYPCLTSGGSPITGTRITTPIIKRTTNISIPWQYNDWRRYEPYTEIYLYLPFAGSMKLPASQLINDSSLTVIYSICATNGDVSILVKGATSNKVVAQANSNIAIDMPFGNTGSDTAKIVGGIVAGSGAYIGGIAKMLASENPITGLAIAGAGMATASKGIIDGMQGNPSGSAGIGGSAVIGLDKVMHCWTCSKVLSDTQSNLNPIIGKPVMKKATIGSYSGYVQTDGASVAGTMLDEEREAINSMLDRGIYYE